MHASTRTAAAGDKRLQRQQQQKHLGTIPEELSASVSLRTQEEHTSSRINLLSEAEAGGGGLVAESTDWTRKSETVPQLEKGNPQTQSQEPFSAYAHQAKAVASAVSSIEQGQESEIHDGDSTPPEEDSAHFDEERYSMGLKQREKLIDELKKENFGLKMRLYFLTENLQKLSPEGVREIINEHAELRALVEDMRLEARLREEATAEVATQQDPESIARIAELEQQIDELEVELEKKATEAENAAVEMHDKFKTAVSEGHAQKIELKKWQEKVSKLEEELARKREDVATGGRVPDMPSQDAVSSDDEHQSPLSLRGKVAKYKKKMEKFRTISLCTAEEMEYLKSELERQTEKLRELEDKFRDDAVRQRTGADDCAKGHKKKTVSSTRDATRGSLHKSNFATKDVQPSALVSINLANADSGHEMRALFDRLCTKLGIQLNAELNMSQVLELFQHLLSSTPTQDLLEGNRQRYITELKQRNELLIHINVSLENLLVDQVMHIKPISHYDDLKEDICTKLDMLTKQHEEYEAMMIEKRLWQTKMSAMEAKVARTLQADRRLAPTATANRRGLSAMAARQRLPAMEINDTTENSTGRKDAMSKFEDGQYTELHDTIKGLQAKLELSRQEVVDERIGAERRVSELLEANRKLEEDLLRCSKTLANIQEHGMVGTGAKHILVGGTPERTKLKRINDELRTDLYAQIHQGGAMRDQMRKTKLQFGKAIADAERLRRQVQSRDQATFDVCRKLAVLNELDDLGVVKQSTESIRRLLLEQIESTKVVSGKLPTLEPQRDSAKSSNPVAPAAS